MVAIIIIIPLFNISIDITKDKVFILWYNSGDNRRFIILFKL